MIQSSFGVTINDIHNAAESIHNSIINTPCIRSQTLSEITGADVILKFENLQFTASFKERGALVKLLSLTQEQRDQGVIAMSAGNHAQAVAYHARNLGISSVIVMPRYTPSIKVEHTRAFGAEVILHGESFDEASAFTKKLALERNLYLVHPYDDPKIIAGQGTIALEMLESCPELETLIIPIGGGGLISGNAIAAKGIKPDIEIIGVETALFPSMYQTIKGMPIECGLFTIAEGISVKQPGKIPLEIVRKFVDEILLVEEDDIEQAVLMLLEIEKTVAEGAGAAGLALLVRNRERFKNRKVGLIISGGSIDLPILSSIIQRGLVRTSRLVCLHVEVKDVPGSLAHVTTIIGNTDTNIIQIHHHRTFTHLPLKVAEVEFVLQTRGPNHVQQIIDALNTAGYKTRCSDNDSATGQ